MGGGDVERKGSRSVICFVLLGLDSGQNSEDHEFEIDFSFGWLESIIP